MLVGEDCGDIDTLDDENMYIRYPKHGLSAAWSQSDGAAKN